MKSKALLIILIFFFVISCQTYMLGIFEPRYKRKFIYLTSTSLQCIKCHGRSEVLGAKTIKTEWTSIQWKGYKVRYIGPHTKIKRFALITPAYADDRGLGEHPVGVPYSGTNRQYKNPPDKPITVPNGYVQCESCHSVTVHGTLVVDYAVLCTGCHLK